MLEKLDFVGTIAVRPMLNEVERDYLHDLADSRRTLRGTPTGRGVAEVPFAYLAWRPCAGGCCLRWEGCELTRMMLPSLRFVVDHLLAPGARVSGHPRFVGFTCDHVLDGAVLGKRYDDARVWMVEVTDNRVTGRELTSECDPATLDSVRRRRPRPANVIEFRPRRA